MMGIFKRTKEGIGAMSLGFRRSRQRTSPDNGMLLSAVYRCVDVISDSVAQLPIEVYKVSADGYRVIDRSHPAYKILSKRPNATNTRFTLIKTLVVSMLLRGNGYAIIRRDKQRRQVVSIDYIPADWVTIVELSNGDIAYDIQGKRYDSCDIIHLLNFSYDGIQGVSTLTHARLTLQLSHDTESQSRGFYHGGANLSGIIKVAGVLTEKQSTALKQAWAETFDTSSGTPNGVAVLEGNMEYQPISVAPRDAQMLDCREFNVVDICRFFSVSPTKCFDFSKSSYSTVEATQLAFLTDTLAPLLSKIELEIERKIFRADEADKYEVHFDTSVLLRADKTALSNYYRNLFNIGVLTPNEIRRQLDLPPIDGGETAFLQTNMSTINNINSMSNESNM